MITEKQGKKESAELLWYIAKHGTKEEKQQLYGKLMKEKEKRMEDAIKKGFMLIPEESLGSCLNCGQGTIIKYCRKYNGYVGKCTACAVSWRES